MEEGKGITRGLTGYVPTGDYWWIQEFYRDWVHSYYGEQLSGGISDNIDCQKRCRTRTVMPMRHYNAPSRRVGQRFVYTLSTEFTGVRQRCWNK